MDEFIVFIAMLGSWLLFAGPVYQAYIELHDAELKFVEIRKNLYETSKQVKQEKISKWFWILPPLAVIITYIKTQNYRDEVIRHLDRENFELLQKFSEKARGWVVIGWGAFFIAVKETYEFVKELDLSYPIFFTLVIGFALSSFAYTLINTFRVKKFNEKYELAKV